MANAGNISVEVSGFLFNGAETLVHNFTTMSQENSHVTWLQNGNFVVSWESLDQDGSGDGVYARLFAPGGTPLSGDLQLHTATASSQTLPQIVATSNGNFVAFWQNGSDIQWQLFQADGSKLGNENTVNSFIPGSQTDFGIDFLSGGNFVVSWNSTGQDGSFSGVNAQRFNHLGTKSYTELQLNTTVLFNQLNPDMAGLTNGHMVAVWESQQNSTSDRGIYMQIYSNTNTPVGGEQLVFDSQTNAEIAPEVVGLTGGGFVVMYKDATNSEIWVKTYGPSTAEIPGGHVLASQNNGSTTGHVGTLTALDEDRFVVTWQTGTGAVGDIGYHVMNADGSTVAKGLVNAPGTTNNTDAEVHKLAQGGFIVAYSSRDASQTGIFIARFTKDGVAVGDPAHMQCQVNTHTNNFQFDSNVSVNDDDDVIVTWTSVNQDGSFNGVYMQQLHTPTLGTIGDDLMNGTAGRDFLSGWEGVDTLNGFAGNDHLEGGSGNDRLFGGDGFDTLDGGSGNDTLIGGNGRDKVIMGAGADLYQDNGQGGVNGQDTVNGNQGNDTIEGGAGNDVFFGDLDNDVIRGRLGNDKLFGGDGFDTLDGGDGNDSVWGGNGRDKAFLGNGNDRFFDNGQGGTLGQDTVFGGVGFDTINGGAGNDVFHGNNGNDVLFGANGNDKLYGGENADKLYGGNGNDTLWGGNGLDQIWGGAGFDTFFFADGFGTDTVFGFDAADGEKISLAGVTGITDFNDLITNHLNNAGGTAQIVDGANSILLNGVNFADVGVGLAYSGDDFIF